MGSERRIVLAHGTSSIHLDAILAHGLTSSPPRRLSEILCRETGGSAHLVSLPGTYLGSRIASASSYAAKAAQRLGGEGMVVLASVPLASLVPDEDEVHCQLNTTLLDAFNPERGSGIPFDQPHIARYARELARDLFGRFDLSDGGAVDAEEQLADAAFHLGKLMLATVERTRGLPVSAIFDTTGRSWAEPLWVSRLASDASGLETYRNHMDSLCRSLVGIEPDSYPAGWESCRGRVVDGVRLAGFDYSPDDPVIVAIGTPECPTLHYADLDLMAGAEVLDQDIECRLGAAVPVALRQAPALTAHL